MLPFMGRPGDEGAEKFRPFLIGCQYVSVGNVGSLWKWVDCFSLIDLLNLLLLLVLLFRTENNLKVRA